MAGQALRSDKAPAILRLLTTAIMKRFCQEAHLALKAKSGCQETTSVGTCTLSRTHQSSSEQNSRQSQSGSSQTPDTSANATRFTAALKTQMFRAWLNQRLLASHRPEPSSP